MFAHFGRDVSLVQLTDTLDELSEPLVDTSDEQIFLIVHLILCSQ